MSRRAVLSVLLLVVAAAARDKEDWLELRSPHFVVMSNAGEKQTRNVAIQFERMRALFQKIFPQLPFDSGSPITVIAAKNEKEFRALEPESYLAKGQLQLAGLFLRGGEKDFVLLRLDAGGDHPYATVYHEYTHFLSRNALEWLPLWLGEGLAEFYENTDIREKEAVVGEPSAENILLLRQTRLLPLATLFSVDQRSPYYHEENKGSIFYAESWAVTHYLMIKDFRDKTAKLPDYFKLSKQKIDSVTAAAQTFGDLGALQTEIEKYVRQTSFTDLKLASSVTVSDADFKVRPLTAIQSAATRAEFLAYNDRAADAKTLLQTVLHDDPSNALGHETMGYMEFRQHHLDQARDWYEKAVKLDSQSYQAHYYYAAMAMMNGDRSAEDDQRIESSLRTALKLNPSFAPAYNQLGMYFGMRRQNLDEAYLLILNAIQLDPGNVGYRLNSANVLMQNHREKDAIRVMETAHKVASTPEDIARVQSALDMARQYQDAREAWAQNAQKAGQGDHAPQAFVETSDINDEAASAPPEEPLKGPHRTATGTIKNVQCSSPAKMDLQLTTAKGTLELQAGNYYKVQYSAVGFVPTDELRPCTDIEGKHATIEYVEASGRLHIVSVQISK